MRHIRAILALILIGVPLASAQTTPFNQQIEAVMTRLLDRVTVASETTARLYVQPRLSSEQQNTPSVHPSLDISARRVRRASRRRFA